MRLWSGSDFAIKSPRRWMLTMAKNNRKNFYAPSRTEGWYEAIGDGKAQRLITGEGSSDIPLYHLAGEKRAGLGQVFSAPDHYNMAYRVANASPGARREMATLLVRQLTAKPEAMQTLMSGIANALNSQADQLWDSLEFHGEQEPRPLTPAPVMGTADMSASEYALMQAMATASMVRERAFDEGQEKHWHGHNLRPEITYIDEYLPVAKAALALAVNEREHGPQSSKAAAIEGFATTINPSMLVRCLDELPVHYGGRDNGFDGPAREETVAQLNVTSLVMRHWDEINASGRYGGGISIGQGAVRALPAGLVEAAGVRVTDQADFDAVRSKPRSPSGLDDRRPMP